MRRGARNVYALALCVLVLFFAIWFGRPGLADDEETVWTDMFWFGWQARILGDQGDGIFRTQIWFYRVDASEGGISARERIEKTGDLLLDLDLMVAEQYDLNYADDLFSLELVDLDSDARLPIRNLSRPLYELYDRALEADMLFEGLPNEAQVPLEGYTADLAVRLDRDPEDPAFQEKASAWYALMRGPQTVRETLTGFVMEMVSALALPEAEGIAASLTPILQAIAPPASTVKPTVKPTLKPTAKPTAAPTVAAQKRVSPISSPEGALKQMFITKRTPIDVRLFSGTKHLNIRQSVQSAEGGGWEVILTVYGTPARFPEIRVECTDEALRILEDLGVEAICVYLESPADVHPFQRWVERHTLEELEAGQ